ncbi:siderophore-interacting protein [Rhodococcus oryzae]|uniref:Siderophore-interacting protein n=1 Tax=Rhodococcus oryzae TaxID=2571143 RepID=A0ABY2RP93_9NOCA|nr:siderophore-interacting protein [Rhodococcus oryzae]TJZ79599.1 siderophore-interacting protein [Rhodococcus oryzae]
MAKRSKFVKPEDRHITRARVLGSKQVSPNFIRVTIGGEELRSFTPMGFDQWFRMFIPQQGQTTLRVPSATSNLWYAQYLAMSKSTRPVVRNYTVRGFRGADEAVFGENIPELDIDFVSHGDTGPASAWAGSATPGDEVALLDEGLIYNPTPEAQWQLLVGDESALPAIMGILGSAPADLRAEVFVEIPHAEDAQQVTTPEGVNLHWLVRSDPHDRPGVLALETVRQAELPTGPSYTFVAGESDLSTGLRRHLVNDRKVPKSDIAFTGYWRHGKSAP